MRLKDITMGYIMTKPRAFIGIVGGYRILLVDESTAVDLELDLKVRLEFSISSQYAESGF